MTRLRVRYFAVLLLGALGLFCAVVDVAPFAYIANSADGTVSVIDIATNTVVGSPIVTGGLPFAIAINPTGTRVYVPNLSGTTVSVIDTSTNTVTGAPITVAAHRAALPSTRRAHACTSRTLEATRSRSSIPRPIRRSGRPFR